MKVWLYYRLSRDEDDELNSLTNQRKIIYEYAVIKRYRPKLQRGPRNTLLSGSSLPADTHSPA